MLPYVVIAAASLFVAGLTLFSGFGIGMLLMPVFAIFFPTDVAVALTAIVHLSNNVIKFALLGSKADYRIVLWFGLPAVIAALGGAWLLVLLADLEPLYVYEVLGNTFLVTPINATLAVLLTVFALSEITPSLQRLTFDVKHLPFGGILSGFFGGLSGHQGALRSAFLLRTGLAKEAFIATGVAIGFFVDIPRLVVYWGHMAAANLEQNWMLLFTAIIAASLGAIVGSRLVKKITIGFVRWTVAVLLFVAAAGLGMGAI